MTRLQRRNFQVYLAFRNRPMSVSGLLWANRRMYLILSLVFTALGLFVQAAFGSNGAALVAVAFAALLLRDIGYYRRSALLWPMLQEVLDWEEIQRRLANDGNPEVKERG